MGGEFFLRDSDFEQVLLARKEVLESIVNFYTEIHQFRNNKNILNKKHNNVRNLERDAALTEDTIATAQKTMKYAHKNRCHSESPQSKGMTVEI